MTTAGKTKSLLYQGESRPSIIIKEVGIEEVVSISKEIPEFDNPHDEKVYEKRLQDKPQLLLIGFVNEQPAGFKVGYEKENDGSFYSWMGAVKPVFRNYGIAKALAEYQELWAKKQGYKKIRFKTRNNLKAMQIFALKNGFNIIAVEPRSTIEEYRILLEKKI